MAVAPLTSTQNVPFLFQQRVLLNVRYWQRFVTAKKGDVAGLDCERERIVTAIAFGLDQAEARGEALALLKDYSPHLEWRGFWEDWGRLLNRASESAWQAGDTAAGIILTIQRARLAQGQGNLEAAIDHYRQAVRLARRIDQRYQQARAYSNLGYLYIQQGHFWRAEVLCGAALHIFEAFDNDHGRAHTENHLGLLYLELTQWDQARQHLERACTIWRSMNDPCGLLFGQINLGFLYIEMGEPDQALPCFEKARQLAQQTGAELELGQIYRDLGVVYRLKGDPIQAEAYARQAEQIFRRFSSLRKLSSVWNNLGLAYLDQGKWADARRYFDASLEIRHKLKLEYEKMRNLVYLIEYDLARGNWDQAVKKLYELESLHSTGQSPRLTRYLQSILVKYQSTLAIAA
ncbi:MAG: tetratricopeptide repeat protein [Chloroflexota bacterium]